MNRRQIWTVVGHLLMWANLIVGGMNALNGRALSMFNIVVAFALIVVIPDSEQTSAE